MDYLILTVRIGLMLTGVAVWVLITAIVFSVMGYYIRTWHGWKKISDWWQFTLS